MNKIGIIGIGKMGRSLALNMLDEGWDVVGYNRSKEKTDALVAETDGEFVPAYSLAELVESFNGEGCRYIWLMLPAGDVVDNVIDELIPLLDEDDLIIDGGNGFYKDAIRRHAKLSESGIRFLDVGVSGGPQRAEQEACMMIGGNREDFEELDDFFEAVCAEDGYGYFGGPGAGHFVKMVHNGIEYGMMEAIAEGFSLLNTCGETIKECTYDINLKDVARVYSNGSIIESRLMEWLEDAFEEWGSDLGPVSGTANQTGEGRWTAKVAKEMNVDATVINDAVKAREYSEKVPSFAGKVIQALRGQFGGHPVLEAGPSKDKK